jgi:hypothetical protein
MDKEGTLKKTMMWGLDALRRRFEVTKDHYTEPHEMCKELLTEIE